MAIYNNREVDIVGPTRGVNPPSTIVVRYKDGSHETVSVGQVKFTQDEKNALVKANPSEYDNVTVTSEDDLKAVRLGVAPASDPEVKARAEEQARREKAEEETRKQVEAAKKDADERLKKQLESQRTSDVNQDSTAPMVSKPLDNRKAK